MSVILEYPFGAKTRTMALAVAFFTVCGAGLVYTALTNDRGLIINGLITLSPPRATVAYWCLAVACVAFVATGVAAVISTRNHPRFVRLTATELTAPKNGFARQPTVVRLRDIQAMNVQTIQRQRMLTIRHTGGSLTIVQSMLPGPAAFEALVDALHGQLQAGQPSAALR